jgi:hypothetical protein
MCVSGQRGSVRTGGTRGYPLHKVARAVGWVAVGLIGMVGIVTMLGGAVVLTVYLLSMAL